MSRFGGTAFALLTLAAASAGAGEASFVMQTRETPLARNAPVRQPILEGENYRFELSIDPTRHRWTSSEKIDRQTLDQRLMLVYRFDLTESLKFGYETGAGFTRNDIFLFDETEPLMSVSAAFSQKANLAVQSSEAFRANSFVQAQRRFVDEQEGFEDSTTYGAEVLLKPFFATTVRGQASYAEKVGFDETLIFQNIYGVSLEQKIPATPFTLRAAQSFVDEERQFLPEQDKTTWRSEASLLWEILPKTIWSAGFQFQDAQFVSSGLSDETQVCFTQFDVPATSLLTWSVRAARERHDFSSAAQTSDPNLSLGLGVKLKVADTLEASFGLKYRFQPDSQTTAPADNASFSLSATGFF